MQPLHDVSYVPNTAKYLVLLCSLNLFLLNTELPRASGIFSALWSELIGCWSPSFLFMLHARLRPGPDRRPLQWDLVQQAEDGIWRGWDLWMFDRVGVLCVGRPPRCLCCPRPQLIVTLRCSNYCTKDSSYTKKSQIRVFLPSISHSLCTCVSLSVPVSIMYTRLVGLSASRNPFMADCNIDMLYL